MLSILNLLIEHCSYLFERPGFRLTDSQTAPNGLKRSYLVLESPDVEIVLETKLGDLTWKMRSLHDPSSRKNWFTFDQLAELLSHHVTTNTLTEENCQLLESLLPELLSRFEKERASETLERLGALKKKRPLQSG